MPTLCRVSRLHSSASTIQPFVDCGYTRDHGTASPSLPNLVALLLSTGTGQTIIPQTSKKPCSAPPSSCRIPGMVSAFAGNCDHHAEHNGFKWQDVYSGITALRNTYDMEIYFVASHPSWSGQCFPRGGDGPVIGSLVAPACSNSCKSLRKQQIWELFHGQIPQKSPSTGCLWD